MTFLHENWAGSPYLGDDLTLQLEGDFSFSMFGPGWDDGSGLLPFDLEAAFMPMKDGDYQDMSMANAEIPPLEAPPHHFFPEIPSRFNTIPMGPAPIHHPAAVAAAAAATMNIPLHAPPPPPPASQHYAHYRDSISSNSSCGDTPESYGSSMELSEDISRSNSVDSSLSTGSFTSAGAQIVTQAVPKHRKTSSASTITEMAPQQPNRRRRRRFSADKKKETHLTRLSGACLRCWRNRKRCIKADKGCCRYCNTLLDPTPNTPFFRSRISSCELFRKGPTDDFCWTRRRWLQTPFNDTKVWRSPQRRLFVTQGMGLRLELLVKQYEPLPEDQDTYTWVDQRNGMRGSWTMPRFAVADIDGAQGAINRYVEDYMQSYISKKISREDVIAWSTFQMAVKLSHTEGSPLLRNALRLWTASRIIEDPWEITGQETLGMLPSTDPGSPYYGKVPVTPVMDFQIDNITIHKILLPLRKEVLQELQKKVLENKRKDFLEIFLTMYVLLHNIELTISHDRWFAQRWNIETRFSNYDLIENVVFGANIMLTYFHHAMKGYAAFALDWKKSMAEKPKEDAQVKFMDAVSTAARQQEPSLRMLKEMQQYESPMFWCSQLFYNDWKPVVPPCH